MSDFGHDARTFRIDGLPVHLDSWGAGPFMFRIDGKRWFFEDSDRFGPSVLRISDWSPSARQPGSRSRFWDAYSMWLKAGRPLRGRGAIRVAAWKEPKPGEYWIDEKGLSHFLSDPDVERAGYKQIPRPVARDA